jgi:hypothetical protein
MADDPIHEHIRAATDADRVGAAARLLSACWPGGPSDRTEPAARRWLRLWRPSRTAATVPACSCTHGRCAVCN